MLKDELYHHGILGQKWGVRRFQNEDGSLTPEGEKDIQNGGDDMSKKFGLERGMRRLADDELMHWKYIKRVRKPDGSYRYYYDVKSTTKGKLIYAKNMYERNAREASKYEDEYRKRSYDYKRTKDEQKKYEDLANKWGHSRLVNDIESKRASQALSSYKKTLRSKIDDKIAVWSTKAAKVLTSNSSKINKAKNWLKDKLFPTNRYARRR